MHDIIDFDGYVGEAHTGPARVLPSRNEGYGFFGTVSREFGSRGAPAEWEKMFRHVASRRDDLRGRFKKDLTSGAVRDFLDSKHGRYLGDTYVSDGVDGAAAAWARYRGDGHLVDFMREYDPKDYVDEGYSVSVGKGAHASAAAVYWMGRVPPTDDFGDPVSDEFVDGKTDMGPWALMSPRSFDRHGVGIGMGSGQRYRKQPDGRWLKVESASVQEAKTFLVFNATDGIYASPDEMTKAEAEKFVREFPRRFDRQGYYLTSSRVRIDPADVKLEIVPLDESAGADTPWKRYATGFQLTSGRYMFFLHKGDGGQDGRLHLSVDPGRSGCRMFYWPELVGDVKEAAAVVAASFGTAGDFDPVVRGWDEHGHRRDLVARWQSRGGKYKVELFHRGSVAYDYSGDGSSGSITADSREEAIAWMERSAVTDQPSADRHRPSTKMPRTL